MTQISGRGSGVAQVGASFHGAGQESDASSRHPLSNLEIQFLAEVGRLSVSNPEFTSTVMKDRRFIIDDISLETLVGHALRLDWTRDPFDRLLVAHSLARRVALCTTDRAIRSRHRLLPAELGEE
jgi:PIN domain nuclease of toxin-antitoxin system